MIEPHLSKAADRSNKAPGLLSRISDFARWIASHVLRRRAAQLVLALLIAFAAAVVVAVLGPWSSEQRIILATIAGFVLFGTLLFYLGYRSWDLARRLSRETAKSREMLLAVHAALKTQNQKIGGYTARQDELGQSIGKIRAQQSGLFQALGSANEQWLLANSRAEQSAAALAALDARVRDGGEAAAKVAGLASEQAALLQDVGVLQQQLKEATSTIDTLRTRQSGHAQGLGATNAQLLEIASRSEDILGAIAQHRAQLAQLAGQQSSLADTVGQLEGSVAAQADRHGAAIADATSRLDQWTSRVMDVEKGQATGFAALESWVVEVSTQHGVMTDGIRTAVARIGAVEGALDALRTSTTSGFDSFGEKATALERLTTSAQGALLSDLADLRAAVSERQKAFAAVSAALDQRIMSLEASVVHLAAQDAAPLARIDTLEDLMSRSAVASATTLDDLSAQIASLKEFARAEAGRVAEVAAMAAAFADTSVTGASAVEDLTTQLAMVRESARSEAARVGDLSAVLKSLGESLQGSLRALGGQTSALEQGLHGAIRQIDTMATTSAQSVAALAEKVAGVEKSAGQDSIRVVQLALSLDNLRAEITEGGEEGSAELAAIKDSIEVLAEVVGALEVTGAAEAGAVRNSLGQIQLQIQAAEQAGQADHAALRDELAASAAENLAEREALKSRLAALSRDVALLSESSFARLRDLAERLEQIRESDQAGQDQVAGVAAELAALQAGLDAGAADGEAAFEEIRQALSRLANEQAETSALHSTSLAELGAIARDHDARHADLSVLTKDNDARLADLSALAKDNDTRIADLSVLAKDNNARLADLSALAKDQTISLVQVAARSASTDDRVTVLAADLSALQASLEDAGSAGDAVFDGINARIETLAQQVADVAKASEGALAGLDVEAGARTLELASVKSHLADLEKAISQAAKASPAMDALETSARASETEIQAIKKGLADLSRNFGSNAASSRQVIEQLSDQFTSLREAVTGEFGRVGGLTSRLASLESAFETAIRLSEQELALTKYQLEDLSGRVAATAVGVEGQMSALSSKVLAAAELAEETDSRLVLDSANWYEPNNRKLRPDHVELLEADWTRRLALDVSRPAIGYMTTRIAALERELDGRLRASIEDTLLRTLVARSVKGAKVRVLELGASFGVETAVMYDQLKDHVSDIGFTILDPLDSLAPDARVDRQTGLHVSERILRRNLARVGLPEKQVSLIKRLSTDTQAIEQASASAYDVAVFDSDRSYAGLKADFENYGRMVRLGGYIVFADYGSPEWPDVTDFVDREVAAAGHVAAVGASWRTAVYRVVRAEKTSTRTVAKAPAKRAPAKRRKK